MKRILGIAVVVLLVALVRADKEDKTEDKGIVIKKTQKELKELVRSSSFVFVTYTNNKIKKGKKQIKQLKTLAKTFKDHEIMFVQIGVKKKSDKLNSMFIYIDGVKRHYTGLDTSEGIENWVYEVYNAKPHFKENLDDIHSIDTHYFVFVEEWFLKENQDRINQLSRLINPLAIIYGLKSEEVEYIKNGQQIDSPMFIYREYNNEIIPIDMQKDTQHISDFIIENEFPQFVYPNEASLRLILEFKLPTLIYFSKGKGDDFVDVMKDVAKPFREYLMLTIVNIKKKDKYTKFLMDFMNVSKAPALRILNMTEKAFRFKFIGKKKPVLISNFLNNYVKGNLEPYTINQLVSKGERYKGILRGNYEMFEKMLADIETTYLVFVYGGLVEKLDDYFELLKDLENSFRLNRHFKIIAINHDKNDLDGYYNDALPFVFIASRKQKVLHYDEDITLDGLIKFVLEDQPHFKVSKLVFSGDL